MLDSSQLSSAKRPSLLIHDYGGYAFAAQLAIELATRQFRVLHCFCGSNPSTPLGLNIVEPVPAGFSSLRILLPHGISKTSFVRRAIQERQYGQKLASIIRAENPELVILANTPIDALSAATKATDEIGAKLVIWVQDLLSEAAIRVLPRMFGPVGLAVGRYYRRRESRILANADHLIPITKDFSDFFDHAGIPSSRRTVIENWAPVNAIALAPKQNAWARDKQLDGKFVFLYSGSLGFKHNPSLLLELASALHPYSDAIVVANTEGPAADWLKLQRKTRNLEHKLQIHGFQPVERLSEVYGASDVLVGLLDTDASAYSVPSKVLSYMCAGRPQLLSIPLDNLAAKIVSDARCGFVSAPDHSNQFIRNGLKLLADARVRDLMGRNARVYAERHFNIDSIADRFESVFSSI